MTDDVEVLASFSENQSSLTLAPHFGTTRSKQSTIRDSLKLGLIRRRLDEVKACSDKRSSIDAR